MENKTTTLVLGGTGKTGRRVVERCRLYELTGPRLLTFADAAGEIAKATGREIRYMPVTPEQYASVLAEHNVPPEYVTLLTGLFTKILDGRNAHLTDDVQHALGRKPRDFTDYAQNTATTGIWNS
jgi:uncharacterized protein YbjT (DUF2867 family)